MPADSREGGKQSSSCYTAHEVSQLTTLPLADFQLGLRNYTSWRLHRAGMPGPDLAEDVNAEFSLLLAKGKGSLTSLWAVVGNPPLSRAAVRHLSAPASSSAVERLFSNVKNVFSDKRRRMKPGKALQCICSGAGSCEVSCCNET